MSEPTVFEVFNEMAKRGDRRLGLCPLSNITKAEIKGSNGFITIGVPPQVVHDEMSGKARMGGLLLVDADAFEEVKAEMQKGL